MDSGNVPPHFAMNNFPDQVDRKLLFACDRANSNAVKIVPTPHGSDSVHRQSRARMPLSLKASSTIRHLRHIVCLRAGNDVVRPTAEREIARGVTLHAFGEGPAVCYLPSYLMSRSILTAIRESSVRPAAISRPETPSGPRPAPVRRGAINFCPETIFYLRPMATVCTETTAIDARLVRPDPESAAAVAAGPVGDREGRLRMHLVPPVRVAALGAVPAAAEHLVGYILP